MSAVRDYLSAIQAEFNTGIAGEHAYRPALKQLLESVDPGLSAVNDPARSEIGMPDFVVLRQPGDVPIGIVEAKDIGNQLSRTEKSEQIKRYQAQGNLILTDYLEFRWYVNGEKIETVRIAKVKNGNITRISKHYGDLTDMLRRFSQQTTQSVNSAQELAVRLARSAQLIAHFIEKDLNSSTPSQNLQSQMAAFSNTLIPDLDVAKFADMYAQTLAYGLFASRVNYPGDPAQFRRSGAAEYIPRTNPFLRRLFHFNIFDLGKRLTWLVESLVTLLQHTDMDSILAHFGQRTGQTDPVVHFYETFLKAYNPKLRETRGVYYTPEPVVKYIVRSVDHILKTCFERSDGLADKGTLILDPAAGTGTFLYYVIERIKECFVGQRGMWKDYVADRLLPRIFGFELLMAPYTIAHMNLGLQLREAGYEFKENERLGVYLTNSLEEGIEQGYETPFGGFLVDEANAATAIKREKPIMVVLGNPPYSYDSQNNSDWISELVLDYFFVDGEPLGERNPKGLQDDYVKFIRFGQWRIEQTGKGILAFITNHGYLDNPTFRGMRASLLRSFTDILIINLHGNTRKREATPEGTKDDNVFDIQMGVSIGIFIKDSNKSVDAAEVKYIDVWGRRGQKQLWLDNNDLVTPAWNILEASAPDYLFVSQNADTAAEFQSYGTLHDVVVDSDSGIVTARDKLTIRDSIASVWQAITEFLELDPEAARDHFALGKDVQDWKVHLAQTDVKSSGPSKDNVARIVYRPFDIRFSYYTGKSRGFMCRPRARVMNHVHSKDQSRENIGLIVGRSGQAADFATWNVVFCVENLVDYNVFRRGGCRLFPIYLYPSLQKELTDPDEFPLSDRGRRPNLSKAFVAEMEAKLGLQFVTEGSAFAPHPKPLPQNEGGASSTLSSASETSSPSLPVGEGAGGWGEKCFGPEDVFYYAYAVFHSPTYRERYAEFLKIDFPRLPLTSDVNLFAALVKLGAELASLHLMKSPKLSNFITTFDIEDGNDVARGYPKYDDAKRRVFINKTQYFGGVSQDIWDFHIGGYRVAEKWLKDRRARKLTYEDLTHYQKIVVALAETMRIMTAIDETIPGFPME